MWWCCWDGGGAADVVGVAVVLLMLLGADGAADNDELGGADASDDSDGDIGWRGMEYERRAPGM